MNKLSWKLVLVPERVEHFSVCACQSRLASLVVNALFYVYVLYKDNKIQSQGSSFKVLPPNA